MFSSELNPEQRDAAIKALASEEFDIVVIGGGVTGAGAVLDAASRGLKVALVEARDLASGTSSRSSKLIHGGLRYLEQYDFKLVREALHERELMVSTLCPHLVKPVGFLRNERKNFMELGMDTPVSIHIFMCCTKYSWMSINIDNHGCQLTTCAAILSIQRG
jgi:glycerol-3-phosphate dehydrogenase